MWTIQEEKGKEMKRWERRERIQKKRGMSELLTPRMGSVDEKDTRWKREWKGKIKTEPGTRIASRLSLVRPMRFERTTFRVGVWHSIQLSYGRVSLGDLYIITERLAKVKSEKRKIFRKGRGASEGRKVLKKGKEKNFEKMLFFSKKVLTKLEGRGIINELSPRQAPESLGEWIKKVLKIKIWKTSWQTENSMI